MSYQAFDVKYKAGFPFVGAIVNMYPGPGGNRGRFIAFDPMTGQTLREIRDPFQNWGCALTTAGGVGFYGTLTGMFRAVDLKTATSSKPRRGSSATLGLGAVGLNQSLPQYTNLGGVLMVFAIPKEVASTR
jgi:lanthanide-dependent methanol dehydrogenase